MVDVPGGNSQPDLTERRIPGVDLEEVGVDEGALDVEGINGPGSITERLIVRQAGRGMRPELGPLGKGGLTGSAFRR